MNSSVPSNEFIPSGCEVYETLGGRINQTSTCTQTFLIIIVVINIITVPFTVVLNALVMIAVKMKSRLRMHKSNIALALLASTDFVVGLLMQPSLIALTITVLLDSNSSASCSFQVFATAVPSVLVSGSLTHLALVSAERLIPGHDIPFRLHHPRHRCSFPCCFYLGVAPIHHFARSSCC